MTTENQIAYKCHFVGGPLDGMTMVKHQMSNRVSCMNEPIHHWTNEMPLIPVIPAPKVGHYTLVNELKVMEDFPPFYRHMIMGWEG